MRLSQAVRDAAARAGPWIMSSYAMERLQRGCVCIIELREKEGTSLHFHSVRMKAYRPVF